MLGAAGSGRDGGEVTTRRKTAGGNERGVELVLLSLTANKAHHGPDVVNLGRPLGVHAAAVVGAHHGIAGAQQGFHDGAQVGCAFTIVTEPGAAVDVDHDGVGRLLLTWQVDVARVVRLVVAGIVHVLPLLGGLKVCIRGLEAAKASEAALRLGADRQRQAQHHGCK